MQENGMIDIFIALAAAAATHNVQVEHRGAPIQAVYSAQPDIRMRTIGAATPNRMDGQRCRWTATVKVERRLEQGGALTRTLSGDQQLSGSAPGACAQQAKGIEREVAGRSDFVRSQLLAVAEQDRAQLLAELDAVRNMATN
jgi:hypothetical protein